jgi:hypothetical protein
MLFHNAGAILRSFAEADGRRSLIESQVSHGKLFRNWILAAILQMRTKKEAMCLRARR